MGILHIITFKMFHLKNLHLSLYVIEAVMLYFFIAAQIAQVSPPVGEAAWAIWAAINKYSLVLSQSVPQGHGR